MSSSPTANVDQKNLGHDTSTSPTSGHGQEPLLIEDGSSLKTTTLEVNGDSVSLQELGPVVINADGTMSRINNWHEMTESEQIATKRVVAKRNAKRREDLLKSGS